jgi:hypothetical protein
VERKPIYAGKLPLPSQTDEPSKTLKDAVNEAKAIREALKVDKADAAFSDSLSVTAIEAFKDDLAYRARINEQISKTRLDERHDTNGNTLYRLQFPISIVPKDNNPNWAKVEIEIRPESTAVFPKDAFRVFYRMASGKRHVWQNAGPVKRKGQDEQSGQNGINSLDRKNQIVQAQKLYEKQLLSMKEFYEQQKYYMPRSISAWSDHFLLEMREEIQDVYIKILDDWDQSKLSENQKLLIDRKINTICYEISDNTIGECNKLIKNCERSSNSKKWKPGFKVKEKGISIKYPITSFIQLGNALKKHKKSRTLKAIKHYLIALLAIEAVSRDYDFLKYVQPKINRLLKAYYLESNPNNLARTIYLTWKKSKHVENFSNYGQWSLLADLTANYTADVYSVNPDEYAQRIEDVAEISKMFGINFAIQLMAGNLGGEAAINYLKGKERLFSTILRKPVVIGLPGKPLREQCESTGNCKPAGIRFGWLIGPVFRIKNDRQDAEFLQAATKKTVSADVSLPSWWRSLSMHATASWVSPDNLSETVTGSNDLALNNPIYLPARHPDFEDILRSTPRPVIMPKTMGPDKKLFIRADVDPSLIIEGKNVWRVHSVSIGNTNSDNIEILGDMQAIKVKFRGLGANSCPEYKQTVNHKTSAKTCETRIRLWSRNAKPIEYANADLIWEEPVEEKIDPDEIKPTIILPEQGLKTDGNTATTKRVKIRGTGIPLNTAEKWMIRFGDQVIKNGGNANDPIEVYSMGDEVQYLKFNVNPAAAWLVECPKTEEAKNGNICEIPVRIFYGSKLLKHGKLQYKIVHQKKTQ